MKTITKFVVHGTPQQQGSKSPQGWETNKKLKPWRLTVAQVAGEAYTLPPHQGPVSIKVSFTYASLKSHMDSRGRLKPDAPVWKSSAPDLDKLCRAIGDALTGVVIADDRLVAEWQAAKFYGQQDGCSIEVRAL